MLCCCRTAVLLLLLLLLLLAASEAQSGERDADEEPRISCSSHIMKAGCSLTCELLRAANHQHDDDDDDEDDDDDDDDGEGDAIEKMSLCYRDWAGSGSFRCLEEVGNTISSKDLTPLLDLNLTVHRKRGAAISTAVDLKKIVKPRSPQVWNVTFDHEAHRAVIHIQIPYHKDYLKLDNLVFQLHIGAAGSHMTQNISSKDFMQIDMEHLHQHTEYHVRVRAIPQKFLQGTWSEWSETFSFFTPAEEAQEGMEYKLIVCGVSLVVLTSTAVVLRKNKIFTYMWPSIPHPKHTLMQICKPNKGLLLNFKPEEFSALKVYPLENTTCEEMAPPVGLAAADGRQSSNACSAQSSDCRSATSVSTEELELAALLSRSSSDSEDGLPSSIPSPVIVLQLRERPRTPRPEECSAGNEAEVLGARQQDEAYVTMSSFYQIK